MSEINGLASESQGLQERLDDYSWLRYKFGQRLSMSEKTIRRQMKGGEKWKDGNLPLLLLVSY